jgi:hypothetical protein
MLSMRSHSWVVLLACMSVSEVGEGFGDECARQGV